MPTTRRLYILLYLLIFSARGNVSVCFLSPSVTFNQEIPSRRSLTKVRMLLEVEQKFQLFDTHNLEVKLKSLGFVSKGAATIVDWYFDNNENYLSTRDYWFRYREISGDGKWEMKKGRGDQGTTVYEEIEGDQACLMAISLLRETGLPGLNISEETLVDTFDGFPIPRIPVAETYGLRPFCRLETNRSSWWVEGIDSPYAGLSVDLDATNTGHTVGEVETLCAESDVEIGKQRVQSLLSELLGNAACSDEAAIGKVEHFLLNNRPEHYAACIASGVLQKQ